MERGTDPVSPAAAASALIWWSDAGVDVMIDEEPRDWLRAKPEARPADSRAAASPVVEPADTPPGQLDLFQAWLASSESLSFASPSAPRVCPSGDPASGLMILADMPSADDCASGALISGPAGRLFERMLAAIGRNRDSIYLAALSCLRSPDGRLATEPMKSCAALARHHIGLVQPRALLLLGDACAKALLGQSMAQARRKWHEVATHAGPVKALVSLPPSYLLDHPGHKAHAWADLQMLLEEVNR